jgi:hypothetical protein
VGQAFQPVRTGWKARATDIRNLVQCSISRNKLIFRGVLYISDDYLGVVIGSVGEKRVIRFILFFQFF